jgi:hypothetical protein
MICHFAQCYTHSYKIRDAWRSMIISPFLKVYEPCYSGDSRKVWETLPLPTHSLVDKSPAATRRTGTNGDMCGDTALIRYIYGRQPVRAAATVFQQPRNRLRKQRLP